MILTPTATMIQVSELLREHDALMKRLLAVSDSLNLPQSHTPALLLKQWLGQETLRLIKETGRIASLTKSLTIQDSVVAGVGSPNNEAQSQQ